MAKKKIDLKKFTLPLIETEEEIENIMTTPSEELIKTLSKIDGDIIVLGCAGKMGPTMTKLAKRAIDEGGLKKRVMGIDRNIAPQFKKDFKKLGIDFFECDMLDKKSFDALPNVENVIYMAGMKFGSSASISLTWALNTYLPTVVAQKYRDSRITVFSSGNIYHLTPVLHGGADENTPPNPFGDYAQSVLGRERMFEYFSIKNNTKVTIARLCYAVDLRYGILLDVAQKVKAKIPIDLTMGSVNVIWQGDANEQILRTLSIASTPATVINITGPETISIRWLAKRFGELMNIKPIFVGEEASTALVFNASKAHGIFGYPKVPLEQIIQWVAYWVLIGGKTLNKPTHFETRDGKF
ncbi:MAG TPA: NAD(P)-dependent oxidoreductase [Bacteroidota bacterium]|nr:NAD(P)-dependent oxidoreductase [Bacteroidota bacterium]